MAELSHVRVDQLPLGQLTQMVFSEMVDAGLKREIASAHDRLYLGSRNSVEAVVGFLISQGWIRPPLRRKQ